MIEIKRETRFVDKLRGYKVMIDEKEVGTIKSGETFDYPIKQGLHTLYLQIDWCRSNKIEFEIKDNEFLRFECGGLNGSKALASLWYITFKRNNYLWIKQIYS
ncbi:hypothetical protein WAK64_10790 [Bacillus spongiae]|uniref:Uncharacterized protein n=1 Tax=Bacillus spongiae TaxID=2683610 RepID=A0ABU8HDV5_9BACI